MSEKTISAEVEITGWDQEPYEGVPGGVELARATVHKTFTGAAEGTSVAILLLAGGEDGRGYIASEQFTGSIDGRKGTVVYQHGGLDDGAKPVSYGSIVPGTGTDELAGLAGEVRFAHEEGSGPVLTLILR